jgi:hypothetical protein
LTARIVKREEGDEIGNKEIGEYPENRTDILSANRDEIIKDFNYRIDIFRAIISEIFGNL